MLLAHCGGVYKYIDGKLESEIGYSVGGFE
jgi:hypothetical protein